MAICRSGAYLRRSHGFLFVMAFRGQTLGFRTPAERVGIPTALLFWDFCATMLLCLDSRYLLSFSGYPAKRGGIKVKCLPAWRPERKAASNVNRRLV